MSAATISEGTDTPTRAVGCVSATADPDALLHEVEIARHRGSIHLTAHAGPSDVLVAMTIDEAAELHALLGRLIYAHKS